MFSFFAGFNTRRQPAFREPHGHLSSGSRAQRPFTGDHQLLPDMAAQALPLPARARCRGAGGPALNSACCETHCLAHALLLCDMLPSSINVLHHCQDMLEGTAGLAVSGCASETEEEQLQDESLPGGRQRPATGTAPKTAGSELRGPTQAHRAAAETYRAALAALNQRGLPQELPPPPAAPCQQLQPLERRQRAAAGPMDARPVCQQLPERLGSARQPSISSRLAWPQPRQALASNATTAVAVTLSISQAAALQEYKDALRVASGLPPELPSPSEPLLPHAILLIHLAAFTVPQCNDGE